MVSPEIDVSGNDNLPLFPPDRVGVSLEFTSDRLRANVDYVRASEQERRSPCGATAPTRAFYALGQIAQVLLRAVQYEALPKKGARARHPLGHPIRDGHGGIHGSHGAPGVRALREDELPAGLAVPGHGLAGGARPARRRLTHQRFAQRRPAAGMRLSAPSNRAVARATKATLPGRSASRSHLRRPLKSRSAINKRPAFSVQWCSYVRGHRRRGIAGPACGVTTPPWRYDVAGFRSYNEIKRETNDYLFQEPADSSALRHWPRSA